MNVTWSESDSGSGINAATRSVQRQSGAPVANACTSATFTNDGAATTAASPRNDTLLTGNTCYRWRVTLVDNAGNSATTTSGTVLIDTTAPTINFTAPTGATSQTSTTVNVAWSESDSGSGMNAATRSIQRQKATPVPTPAPRSAGTTTARPPRPPARAMTPDC